MRESKGFSLLEVVVAVAILGVAIVALIELFSLNLRTVKRNEDYTRALIFARSVMDGAYATADPEDASGSFESGPYHAERQVSLATDKDGIKVFDIGVRVTWPPRGSLSLQGRRILHEKKE